MGWTGFNATDREAALRLHLSDCRVLAGPEWRPGCSALGYDRSYAWVLVVASDGRPLIVQIIVEGTGPGEWFVKDVDETMGPLTYDCPLPWLDRSPCREGPFLRAWRAEVRARALKGVAS